VFACAQPLKSGGKVAFASIRSPPRRRAGRLVLFFGSGLRQSSGLKVLYRRPID
jgi:hypothetical protein